MSEPVNRERAVVATVLFVCIAWQVYVVAAAWRHSAAFEAIFAGLGAEVPIMTRVLFATVRFWFVVPLVFALLAVDIVRTPSRRLAYVVTIVALAATVGFVMQAWSYEAYLAPLLSLSRQIG
jgi:hypothetical protein